jgi:hypothetical protein
LVTTEHPRADRSATVAALTQAPLQQPPRRDEILHEPLTAGIEISVAHATDRRRGMNDPAVAGVDRDVRDCLPRLGKEHDVARVQRTKIERHGDP